NIGLVNVGTGGDANPIRIAHETAAYLADGGNITVTGGPLAFLAESSGNVNADNFNIGISLANVSALHAVARLESTTRAFVGANAQLTAGNVSMTARSTGNSASASISSVDVSLLNV